MRFIIGIFVYKTIKLKDIPRILVKGAATTAVSLFIIAMASIFSWFLAWESFPETVVNVMQALTSNGTVALCMVILFLFVLGLFVEGIPVLIVFAPILVPAMEAYGIDTLYFGIVLVLTVLVGSITRLWGVYCIWAPLSPKLRSQRQVKRYGYSWR